MSAEHTTENAHMCRTCFGPVRYDPTYYTDHPAAGEYGGTWVHTGPVDGVLWRPHEPLPIWPYIAPKEARDA